jgi:hypothetical protein
MYQSYRLRLSLSIQNMPYLAIFWELFSLRKFIGETHFRGRPGRELTAAAAFAASDLVIRIACP